jgi:hypothetical protein
LLPPAAPARRGVTFSKKLPKTASKKKFTRIFHFSCRKNFKLAFGSNSKIFSSASVRILTEFFMLADTFKLRSKIKKRQAADDCKYSYKREERRFEASLWVQSFWAVTANRWRLGGVVFELTPIHAVGDREYCQGGHYE